MTIPNVPELQKSYLQGVVDLLPTPDELYPMFRFFPKRLKAGIEWKQDIKASAMSAASVRPLDTETTAIQPAFLGKLECGPHHMGEHYVFTQKERQILRQPGSDMRVTREETVTAASQLLRTRTDIRVHKDICDALALGTITVTDENGLTYTVTYPSQLIGTIANPGTWNAAAATIVQDVGTFKRAFKAANGVLPNVCFYNSDIEEYFLKNTEFTGWVKAETQSRSVQNFLEAQKATPGAMSWRWQGIEWVPVDAMYAPTESAPTTMQSYWPKDTLVFARTGIAGEQLFESWSADTDETDGTGGPTVESFVDTKVKGRYGVRCYRNHLPIVTLPYRCMRVADVAP